MHCVSFLVILESVHTQLLLYVSILARQQIQLLRISNTVINKSPRNTLKLNSNFALTCNCKHSYDKVSEIYSFLIHDDIQLWEYWLFTRQLIWIHKAMETFNKILGVFFEFELYRTGEIVVLHQNLYTDWVSFKIFAPWINVHHSVQLASH